MQAAIWSVSPAADIRVLYGRAPEVSVSLLEWNKADPAYLMCLPEADRWRMVPRAEVFQAPMMELYSKFPDLRTAAITRIQTAVADALAQRV